MVIDVHTVAMKYNTLLWRMVSRLADKIPYGEWSEKLCMCLIDLRAISDHAPEDYMADEGLWPDVWRDAEELINNPHLAKEK